MCRSDCASRCVHFGRHEPLAPEPLAVGAAGEVVLLDDLRKDDRQTERRERQIQALESQRGNSDGDADREAQQRRDGNGREERPVVIGDEDRGRECAGAHERAVAERHLAGQAGDDVEAHHGDRERHRVAEETDVRRARVERQPDRRTPRTPPNRSSWYRRYEGVPCSSERNGFTRITLARSCGCRTGPTVAPTTRG